jgi:hypothetical protein
MRLVTHGHLKGIQCLKCNRISWDPNDVANVYCGNCHEFGVLDGNNKQP